MQDLLPLANNNTSPALTIIGLGGAGGHMLERLQFPLGSKVLYLDTDGRSLESHKGMSTCIQLGQLITRGLSSGGDFAIAKQAIEASGEDIEKRLQGSDLVIILTGLAGGTGGGAAATLANIAQKAGALAIAFGILPFSFEGDRRALQAEAALSELRKTANAVIPLSNARLLEGLEDRPSVLQAFAKADIWANIFLDALWQALTAQGYTTIDLATLSKVLKPGSGKTLFGIGIGEGNQAISAALEDLMLCPLLHLPDYAQRADRLLLCIRTSESFLLEDLRTLGRQITEKFSANGNLQLAITLEPNWVNRLELCVIGTTDTGESKIPLPLSSKQDEEPSSHTRRKTKNRKDQEEFTFTETSDSRGFFSKTATNAFGNEDLDIPTYLRKGIRLK